MLNSENTYHINISFKQRIEGILLTVIGANFEIIYSGIATEINLKLAQGIYKLTARYLDYLQVYLLIVNQNEHITLEYYYPAVAPILDFDTTHEYYHGNAEYYSKNTTEAQRNYHPNFLFFAAKYYKDECPNIIMVDLLINYSIINGDNEVLYQFDLENTRIRPTNPIFFRST